MATGATLAESVHSRKLCNTMYIGTAAWSVPRDVANQFPGDGQHLERYARRFACVEINSSFYRSHQVETYARWAAMTPPHFRFAVKLPRAITHDAALRGTRKPLRAFLDETAGLGDRRGVLLAQLPPSLAWDARVARTFFALLRDSWDGPVACEPRHASWFEPAADRALARLRAARGPLQAFLAETAGLGAKLGVLLVQLPPSLAYEARVVRTFFGVLRASWDGAVACEPRHASWFEPAADRALASMRIARVAADPARSGLRVPRSAASCVIARGSFTAKRNPAGVMPAQRA